MKTLHLCTNKLPNIQGKAKIKRLTLESLLSIFLHEGVKEFFEKLITEISDYDQVIYLGDELPIEKPTDLSFNFTFQQFLKEKSNSYAILLGHLSQFQITPHEQWYFAHTLTSLQIPEFSFILERHEGIEHERIDVQGEFMLSIPSPSLPITVDLVGGNIHISNSETIDSSNYKNIKIFITEFTKYFRIHFAQLVFDIDTNKQTLIFHSLKFYTPEYLVSTMHINQNKIEFEEEKLTTI
jgi:hypothetical protein